MRTFTGLLARIAAAAVAVSTLSTGCAFGRTMVTPRLAGPDAAVPYRLVQEPDVGYEPIFDLIRSSVSSVRMTMYELSDDAAVTAVIDAHRRGVDVKVILNRAYHGRDTNRAAYDALHAAGIDVKWAPNDVIHHQLSGGLTL